MMETMQRFKVWLRVRREAARLLEDRSAIAATEFAVIVPLMLVLFFGTVEFSSGVAVDRKVTLTSSTLSDLTSQSPPAGVTDSDLRTIFTATIAIMKPYSMTPVNAIISELYVDPNSLQARVQWSKAYQGDTARAVISTVRSDAALGRADLSDHERGELSLRTHDRLCDAKSNIILSDVSYSSPRQVTCVYYPPASSLTPCPTL